MEILHVGQPFGPGCFRSVERYMSGRGWGGGVLSGTFCPTTEGTEFNCDDSILLKLNYLTDSDKMKSTP